MDYKMNMGVIDRTIRYFVGIILLIWVIAGGPPWAILGIYPLATAAWGFCPIYYLAKINQSSED